MNIKIQIKRVTDGVVAEIDKQVDNVDGELFYWQDGNAACDCNRELFFLRTLNLAEDTDNECGNDRFLVRISDESKVLHDEFL